MAEQIDLSAATGSTTVLWRVKGLDMERGNTWNGGGAIVASPAASFITVRLIGQSGLTLTHTWRGESADADIVALNKANLSGTSLYRRIINKLIADGVIAGTATGTPD